MKTVFDLSLQERQLVQNLVAQRLRSLIDCDLNTLLSSSESSKKRKTEHNEIYVFGNQLDRVPATYVDDCGMVPLFLYNCVTALSQFTHLEGIFRKAGSIQRQKELRNRVDQGLAVDIGDISLAYDVASLIKQFLRELPEPVFTDALASCCLHCAQSPQAVLLLSMLLPPAHLSTLKFVCMFLKQVSDCCDLNKMSARNLALVFSPSLFPNEPIRLTSVSASKSSQTIESARFHDQILVLELLIANANDIGLLPPEFIASIEKMSDDENSQQASSGGSSDSAEMLDGLDRQSNRDVSISAMQSRKRKSRGSIHSLFTDISHSLAKLRRSSFGQAKENVAPKSDADSFAETFVKDSSVCGMNDSKLKRRRMSTENFEAGGQVLRFRKSLDGQQVVRSIHSAKASPQLNRSPADSIHSEGCKSPWQPVQLPLATLTNCQQLDAIDIMSMQTTVAIRDGRRNSDRRTKICADAAAVLLDTPRVKPQMANFDLLLSKNSLCRALHASGDRKRICVPHDDRQPAVRVKLL